MVERVQLLEKASRQFELDNERLAFKVLFLSFIKLSTTKFIPKGM